MHALDIKAVPVCDITYRGFKVTEYDGLFHDYNFDLRCDSLAAPTAATAPAAATAPTTPTRPDGGWLHGQSILLATLLNLLVGKSSALKLDLEDLASHAPVLWK